MQDIEDLITAYAHDIDDGELDRWPTYFAEDGIYTILTRENLAAGLPMGIMHCQGRGMMVDRIKAMQTANIFEEHTYCHILGRSEIKKHGRSFEGRTNFTVLRTMQEGRTETFAVGKYLDHFTKTSGKTLIAERKVVLESRRVDILLVCPL
ncbi:MAG: nuclear transport factor 2 family protein [Alphaproteobacteria bacterium]|nr:nuclear transport factor 2 family protein [Alphaproteobacteria bacterium]